MIDTFDLRNHHRRIKVTPCEGGEVSEYDIADLRRVKPAAKWLRAKYGPPACNFVRVVIHVRQGDGFTHADCAVWSTEGLFSRMYETRPSQTTARAAFQHRDRCERWAIQFARSVGAQRLYIENQA